MRIATLLLGLLATASIAATPAVAEPWAVGTRIPGFTLEDQHGKPGSVDAKTRGVLFTREMGAGRMLRGALEGRGAAVLGDAGHVYVSDVSGMPGIIRRLFALPSLRRRPYPILLDLDGATTGAIPSEDGKVTWLRLEGLEVVGLDFLSSAEELKAALGIPAAP